ncbi:carbohydrate kinase [Panacibacter ginsenosidivorans]|uniref:Carbohydrate kinase n=1 Tax=Panacibacter ginsenosidivorans TaxID=1813871 RepID=A0A5B8V4S3_9BACT|nr:FGGY family carbohydrate kinase [Panacibacter ginsenosidivorans]QEC65813.1 carbohydrate kinase [Panacibacter ginsenosidivorans]
MLLLGIDVGTSSIKVSVVDAQTQQCIASASYPETEAEIISQKSGWAEQSPNSWWQFFLQALVKAHATKTYNPKDIAAIGIAYQMHGLVTVDEDQQVLRDAIIWCDSRAVPYGDAAFKAIGEEKCLSHLLNSPGNFTAAKLAWVKENEPLIYERIDKIMLPGDYIAMLLTGSITTSISSLSEGIFWDFKENALSKDVMNFFGFNDSIIPTIKDVFSEHGYVTDLVANLLQLKPGIPVSYKAGDQPNNALSLNVLEPGEVAATAGTSGVIYGVSDQLAYDQQSRVNSFAHVNYTAEQTRIGILLCINGTGILNKWIKNIAGTNSSYADLNNAASKINIGSDGLYIIPFGNGAERMLNNKIVGTHLHNIDLNKHTAAHLYRAGQEGIAFAFRYGLDIMRENKMFPSVIRAGKANMFLSSVFTNAFVNVTNTPVELYNCDGSVGAALGAGIGAKIFNNPKEAFTKMQRLETIEPNGKNAYEEHYQQWKALLIKDM